MTSGVSFKKALLIVMLASLAPTLAWSKSPKTAPPECIKRLLQFYPAHDAIHPNPSLPKSIELALRKQDISQYFALNADAWKEGADSSKLESLLHKIASGQKLTEEESETYKNLRARLKQLRFSFIAFSKDHRAPKSVEKLTIALGKAQDAYKNDQTALAKKEVKKAIQLLDDGAFDSIKSDIKKFEPAKGKSFRKWIGSQIGILSDGLKKDPVTPKEFHELRKVISRLVSVYGAIGAVEPGRNTTKIIQVLSTLNGKMGAVHDSLITGKFAGKIDYEHGSAEIPEDIRKLLQEVVQRFDEALDSE